MRAEHGVTCGGKEVINVKFNARKVVESVQEKVRILVVAENEKVYEDDENHQELLFPLRLRGFNPLANKEVRNNAEDENADIAAASLVVEEHAGRKQECVAKQKPIVN